MSGTRIDGSESLQLSRPMLLSAQFVQPLADQPVDITSIKYDLLSDEDVHKLSVLSCQRVIGAEKDFGVNDPRLGSSDRFSLCATCGKRSADCAGHAGHIDLEVPVFHLGFFSAVLRICRTICKRCSHVLLVDEEKEYYSRRLLAPAMEAQTRTALIKKIQEDAYKTRICTRCGGINGVVRRLRSLRMVHEVYGVQLRRGEECVEDMFDARDRRLRAAAMGNTDVDLHRDYMQDFLHPGRVKQLFMAIPPEDYILLGLQPRVNPIHLLVNSLLVPPVCVRPRGMSGANQVRDDDLTTQYNDILICSEMMKDGTNDAARYVETWELLQMRVARLLDAGLPGFPAYMHMAECKSYAQRMKGKQGRFRGNLSGKRVDFSGRSVISPDPNLRIDELAVPLRVARILTYPERVYDKNIQLMRRLVRNGPLVHPGALTVFLAKEQSRKSLRNARDRESIAARLAVGDIVERHVMNGDYVLFNRQPSLHRVSLMAHRARVLPYRTFRFNECCCAPYNADFDGDEMNVHLVQTEEARAEARELMLTSKNIITAKNGEPIIACTQDFLTAAYLVTSRDVFFTRSAFTQMVSHWLGATTLYSLPIPAILKPAELWTGKQLMQLILCPSPETELLLSLEGKARSYTGKGKHNDSAEGYVAFLDSVFLSGRLDKKLLGGGAKDGLFARLFALAGGDTTATCMTRISQFTSRYLQNYGFSLGLGDVAPTPSLEEQKRRVLAASFAKCDQLISLAKTGRLIPNPGMSVKQTLEAKLNGELSQVRDACGNAAIETLDAATNAPMIMVNAGSKGSALNSAQMTACVGQQTVNGKRIMNAFQDRSLPHFYRFAEDPGARGFVASSFYSGLSPTEFFFHTMAGREGIVDTAVKTAETGYIYRRLSKAMENMKVSYDHSVRNVHGGIVQLRYGEDGLDPWLMEGAHGTPLNLDQEWISCSAAYARLREAASRAVQQKPPAGYAALYTDWHATVMKPSDVVPFVRACMEGEEEVLAAVAAILEAEEAAAIPAAAHVRYGGRRALDRFAQQSSPKFRDDVCAFFQKKAAAGATLRQQLGLDHLPVAAASSSSTRRSPNMRSAAAPEGGSPLLSASAADSEEVALTALHIEALPLTKGMLLFYIQSCAAKYICKACEPGTPCGAIAAQSVGEPSTQMTLRTFHFAGVASMSITQGVPRLVEVINANKNIATPVITAPIALDAELDRVGGSHGNLYQTARAVKGRMERVLLKEVATDIVEVATPAGYYLQIFLSMPLIAELLLPIDAVIVCQRLYAAAAKPMSALRHLREECVEVVSHDSLIVYPYERRPELVHYNVQHLLTLLPELVVCGVHGISRVMIADKGAKLLAEGAELLSVMSLPYVDGTRATSNHVAVVERTLGIEAARETIVKEINNVLQAYSLNIDFRHIYLLADVMTSRGATLGITRYGIQKMDSNVLTLASFERTTEHLYNAAVMQREDVNLSVSESIIVGKPIPLGTSAFEVLLDQGNLKPAGSVKGALHPSKCVSSNKTRSAGAGGNVKELTPKNAFYRRMHAIAQMHSSGLGKHVGVDGLAQTPLFGEGTFRLDLFA